MIYLVELIKETKPEIDSNAIEYVVSFLIKEGHLSYTVQYHFDIYTFYIKSLEHYKTLGLPRKSAFIDTREHFKISERNLYRIISNFAKPLA